MSWRNYTKFDADRHNARVASGSTLQVHGDGSGIHFEQVQVGSHNGTIRPDAAEPGTENSVLRPACVDVCKRRDWLVFTGKTNCATGRTPGETDLVVAADQGCVIFAELKTRTGKMSNDQLGVEAWLKRLGHWHIVARSAAEFEEKVEATIALHKWRLRRESSDER